MKEHFFKIQWDFVGLGASLACAVHCLIVPFLVSLAPLAGFQVLNNVWIEYTVIMVGFVIAAIALWHGYRHHHGKPLALIIVIIGFLLIGTGHFFQVGWVEIVLASIGATVVAVAHLINWKHIRQSHQSFSVGK